MARKIGCGCLVTVLLLAGLLFAFAQTESGKWLVRLVTLYGGSMVAGAAAHDTVTGQVIDFNRLDPPTHYTAGSISFTYQGDDGTKHKEYRRVMYSTDKFRALKIGDAIEVWVCRNDRSKVKLVGYGTYEPEGCADGQPGKQ